MSKFTRWAQAGGFVFVLLCLWIAAAPADAAPFESIQTGSRQLAEGRLEEALQSFQSATEEHPENGQAHFFVGVTLNRLGRPDEALQHLTRAGALGARHPELAFETGWSLLMLRRWEPAIEQLTRYDAASPGRGQTSEFLGRAYLALGRLDEAEAHFARAMERDAELIETVSLYRALLQQRRGDERKAVEQLSILLRDVGDSTTTRIIRSQLEPVPGAPTAAAAQRPWRLGVAMGGGYNSDARGTQAINSTADVPSEGSAFVHIGLDAGYTLLESDDDRVAIGYQLLADFYAEQEQDPDLLDQYAYLEYQHALGPRTTATARLSANHTMVGEETLRTQLATRGSLAYQVLAGLAVETSYGFAYDDYEPILFTDPDLVQPRVVDRDAEAHTLTLGAYFDVPGTRVRLRGGYFYTWNFAEHDEFDYQAEGLFAGARVPLWWKVTANVVYTYTRERYEDDLLDDDGDPDTPIVRRRDSIQGLSIRLTRPLTPHLSAYLEYNFNHDNSTDPGYDYEQHVTSAGLAWQF